MFTKEMIKNACEQHAYNEFNVTMSNGDVLTISPCTPWGVQPTIDNVEYWLVYGPLPWLGCDNIDQLLTQLNGYTALLAEADEDKKKLKDFFEKHIQNQRPDDDTLSFYSDWHKDVFGFRPAYGTFGVHR